nr:receptor like protein 30 [Quercus suber]
MVKVMGGRFLKLLYAFLTLLLHLKPAHGFTSGVGDDSVKCIENERQALLEFKKGFVNGDDKLSSWGSEDEKNCCNWDGVYCNNQTGHVLKLYFYGLRDASGNMNSLQFLYLDENQLEGGVTKFFGNMCALHILSIENNKLSEQLAELIHNLSGCVQYSLKGLHLHGNQLKGSVPKSIGNLSALWSLLLGSNLLEGEISEQHFSNLSILRDLSLSDNSLTLKSSNDWVPPFRLITIDLSSCNLGPDFPKCEYCKIAKDVSRLRNIELLLKGLDNKKKLWARLRV